MRLNPSALVALRKFSGMSQAELARRSGVSQGHISELERGDKCPRPATITKIAAALRVPVSALLCENDSDDGLGDDGAVRKRVLARGVNGTASPAKVSAEARQPVVGENVVFRPDPVNGSVGGVVVPALVLRTKDTSLPATPERPEPLVPGSGSVPRPPGMVTVLPNDRTVDLVVFGLIETYRAYSIPHGDRRGCWCWPEEHASRSPLRSSARSERRAEHQ